MDKVEMKCKKCGESEILMFSKTSMQLLKSAKCTCGGSFEFLILKEEINEPTKTNRN